MLPVVASVSLILVSFLGHYFGAFSAASSFYKRYKDKHTDYSRRAEEIEKKNGAPSKSPAQKELGEILALFNIGSQKATFSRLFKEFEKADWRYIIPASVLSITLASIGFVSTSYTATLMDYVVKPGATLEGLWPLIGNVAAIRFGLWLGNVVNRMLYDVARWRMAFRERDMLFRNIITQDMGFFDENRSTELHSRLCSEPDRLQDFVIESPAKIVNSFINLFFGLWMVFSTNSTLAWLGLIVKAPFVTFLQQYAGYHLKKYRLVRHQALHEANLRAAESLQNIRTVQAHAAEGVEQKAYTDKIRLYVNVMRHSVVMETLLSFTDMMVGNVQDFSLMALGMYLVMTPGSDGEALLTIGQYTAFRTYLGNTHSGYLGVVTFFQRIPERLTESQRYFELLDRKPLIPPASGATPKSSEGVIELRNVTFRYASRPDKTVLRDISTVMRPGEVTALVGTSGAGKSTLMKLLLRFYDPVSGVVLLDGRDIRELDVRWLRRRIGYVEQEPLLFDRTMAENIAYASEPEEEIDWKKALPAIQKAALLADCHDFISDFPEGYATLAGERGQYLSGGQRQRIAIARALYRDPRILLLDEATSSLDAESEAKVQRALATAMEGRTTVVIAHRLSTIRRANQILVVEHGEIIERGTHNELLKADGKYASFIRHQSLELTD